MHRLKRYLAGIMAVCIFATNMTPTMVYATESASESAVAVSSEAEDANSNSEEVSSAPAKEDADSTVVTPDAASGEGSASSDSSSSSEAQEPTETPAPESKPEPTPEPTETPDSVTSTPESETTDPEATPEPSATPNPAEEFVSFALIDPENGDTYEADLGEEVTLTAKATRDDVAVKYQWQVMYKATDSVEFTSAIYDYQDQPTWYDFPFDDLTESDALEENPDATWSGIEMYYAVMDALDAAGEDSSNVRIAWKTRNFALDGYTISAEKKDDHVEIYADKDEERYTATLNEDGEWEFSEDAAAATDDDELNVWHDIEGATEDTYTFEVGEQDFSATYRCMVTITDEAYLAKCVEILKSQNIELTDQQLSEDQILYTIAMYIHSDAWDQYLEEQAAARNGGSKAETYALVKPSDHPKLSSDTQWILGLNNSYEYLTKDTYERVCEWQAEGKVTDAQAKRYWTRLGNGFSQYGKANVLDNAGLPTGEIRYYNGVDLTDGAMEVLSEWYGKTVLFRVHGSNDITEIKIPAYTNLTVDEDGNYVEAASGTKYKKAVTILNAYVPDTGSKYKNYLSTATSNGWLSDSVDSNAHIRMNIVDCESFNKDPERYLVDAEGNFRMDSFAWGVCTYQEPDLSGKAYWCLKNYLANGYGFLIGHDTLYAYAGAYYDALRNAPDPYWQVFRESEINPKDTATWYYNVNSWTPNGSSNMDSPDNNWPWYRGGHWYLNELIGSNKGNVYSGTTKPSDAPSLILSTGGSHGRYGKRIMYGSTTLGISQLGYTTAQAIENPKYRTPTNYPYAFTQGQTISANETHSNGQAAFGPIWVKYAGANFGATNGFGCYPDPKYWTIDGKTGTNNFYLSGNGNFLMNQVGHLPKNSAKLGESRVLMNSILYISQRKQCEVCAAEQNGQSDTHFVRRINSANKDKVLDALKNGGNFWYRLDGCYMLTENITLPDDWVSIKGFTGHWNNDVYKVTLGKNGAPLLEQADDTGWNLGTDKTKGTMTVFDENNKRTTGVARVLGDLNDLFSTDMNYAGYTVKIYGKDNKNYLPENEIYTCKVNSDSKYIISNLPCIYDGMYGILLAHVYDPDGNEVTQYGKICVNVYEEFWDTCDTIPLYLYQPDLHASPIPNRDTYEGEPAVFTSVNSYDEKLVASNIKWQYREDEFTDWKDLAVGPWGTDYSLSEITYAEDELLGYVATQKLTINHPLKTWNGYQFRTCTSVDGFGTINSWEFYKVGKEYFTINGYDVAAAAAAAGTTSINITTPSKKGELTVKPWPFKVYQAPDQEVWITEDASFTVEADYWKGIDDGLTVEWQTRANVNEDWEPMNLVGATSVETSSETSIPVYEAIKKAYEFETIWQKHTKTTLTIPKCDLTYYGYLFRVHFSYATADGEVYDWYSDAANGISYTWDIPVTTWGEPLTGDALENHNAQLLVKPPLMEVELQKAADEPGSCDHIDDKTPDEYGQAVEITEAGKDFYEGTVYYTAIVHYRPGDDILNVTPKWQYRTYLNKKYEDWTDAYAKSVDSRMSVEVQNTNLGVLKPGDKYYNATYDGFPAIKSVMTIKNPSLKVYDTSTLTAYYFRCYATANYTTALGPQQYLAHSTQGDLLVDYNISLHHMGVNTYGKRNIINSGEAKTVDDIARLTSGKSYSDWQYPELTIQEPRYINTMLVQFTSQNLNSNDAIYYDSNYANSIGVSVSGNNKVWTFRAKTNNTVETWQWQELMRRMTFRTYDPITFGDNQVTGGVKVMWYADEKALDSNSFYNSDTGHFYSVIRSGSINWNTARSRANNMYNEALETYGYLVHITTGSEWDYVYKLAGGSACGWLGAARQYSRYDGTWVSGWDWYWVDGPRSEEARPFFHQSGTGGYTLWGFTNWKSGEPNNSGNETVAHFYPYGSWNDFNVGNGEVNSYVVEWGDDDTVGIKPSNHSVADYDTIGTQAKLPVEKIIRTNVTGGVKMYDGTELMPTITVTSDTVTNPAQYVQAIYTCTTTSAQYTPKNLPATATSGDNVINYGNYTVTLSLTEAGVAAGIQLSADSVTTAPLKITKRPINIYSRDNDKVYDGNDRAIVRNIKIEDPVGDHGLIAGDVVVLKPTEIPGIYESKHKGTDWNIAINGTISFAQNPYNNYYIDRESYTGSISARPLRVHSLYLEDPKLPRNVKEYDSTTAATITDILIDNIVGGDTVWINKDTYNGFYATSESGEQVDENGNPYPDRDWRLDEIVITRDPNDAMTLINDPFGDYYIAQEEYSGGILRTTLEIRVWNKTVMYGTEGIETPFRESNFDSSSDSDNDHKIPGWLHIYGLKGPDTLTLTEAKVKFGAFDKDDNLITFEQKTPVGEYPVIVEGITEANFPVLHNYLIAKSDGMYEITPRPVTVTAQDIDWYTDDSRTPIPYAKFEMLADDGETQLLAGVDDATEYTDMPLILDETVSQYIRVIDKDAAIPARDTEDNKLQKWELLVGQKEFGSEGDSSRHLVFNNGTNIRYSTFWYQYAPAKYLDKDIDAATDRTDAPLCDWCKNYHSTEIGARHAELDGYEIKVNQNPDEGKTLVVATVENPLGKTVQNYELHYVSGTIRVHPILDIHLEATVPMYVCMYGYRGDGEVVEPTNYGITNYTRNSPIVVDDLNVGELDNGKTAGWNIVDKTRENLQRGEMSMYLNDKQLVMGHQKPTDFKNWLILRDDSTTHDGVKLTLPMQCYIAGGNVNDAGEDYVTKVTYTVSPYTRRPLPQSVIDANGGKQQDLEDKSAPVVITAEDAASDADTEITKTEFTETDDVNSADQSEN